VEATSIATSAVTITPVTLTDETGCPGVFCIYTGSDLFIDADHLCQTRATDAQNWEAWIKDTRDSKIYRIVQMPDDHWWMAQPLAREAGAYSTNSSTGVLYYADITAGCPSDWVFPSPTDWSNLVTDYGGTNYADIKTTTGWTGSGYAAVGNDSYGISIAPTGAYAEGKGVWAAGWYNVNSTFQMGPSRTWPSQPVRANHEGSGFGFGCKGKPANNANNCKLTAAWGTIDLNYGYDQPCYTRAPLRCFRQL
jgi:uncharacterized protein (TIGR02145 family)